ncbi:MAG: DNA-protecting protein DprA [Firmicutes bacterium]|nr:DNA-protecting protein DprA [Candidatus Fermentithermobacillaceae bacterium]
MDDLVLWVALTLMPGMRPSVYERFLEKFPDPLKALGSPVGRFGALPPGLVKACSLHWKDYIPKAREVLAMAEKKGMGVLSLVHPSYPERLRQIPDPPLVLYVKGEILPRDRLAVAVVGTRTPSVTGLVTAERMGRDLAAAGITVVSGLARGIDSQAHRGAIQAGGRTGAVLGSGLDVVYPRDERRLYENIRRCGWVISEYPPGSPPLRWHFLERNRIISGLAMGVVVVEAGLKSGALSTVERAIGQGRPVMAVPGSVSNPSAAGTNMLLADGAGLVTCAKDVLCFLKRETEYVPECKENENSGVSVTLEEGEILRIVGNDVLSPDEILRRSPFPPGKSCALISALEIKGLLERMPGGRLVRR